MLNAVGLNETLNGGVGAPLETTVYPLAPDGAPLAGFKLILKEAALAPGQVDGELNTLMVPGMSWDKVYLMESRQPPGLVKRTRYMAPLDGLLIVKQGAVPEGAGIGLRLLYHWKLLPAPGQITGLTLQKGLVVSV